MVNFYRRFMKKFCKFIVSLTWILQITNDDKLNFQLIENKVDHNIPSSTYGVGKNILSLPAIAKLAKSKKMNLAMSKKSDFAKNKKLTLLNKFVKAIFGLDFHTAKAKKVLIYL